MKTKISTGKIDNEEKLKGKVPAIDDMEEGSEAEEANETPKEEAKEEAEGEAPDKDDELESCVEGLGKDELEQLIKLAQGKLENLSSKQPTDDAEVTKY